MSKSILGDVLKKYHNICQYCGEPIRSGSEAICHHYINRKFNGPSTIDNLLPRHKVCEKRAHNIYVNGNPEEGRKILENKKSGYTIRINGRDVHITYPHKDPNKTTIDKPQPAGSRFSFRRVSN